MIKFQGLYSSATAFLTNIEPDALSWLYGILNHPVFENVPVVQMPDCHAGQNCNIGTAFPVNNYICPSHVGVDIGCTISMHKLSNNVNPDDYALLDHRIRAIIPFGLLICAANQKVDEKELYKFLNKEYQRAYSLNPDYINPVSKIDEKYITALCKRIHIKEPIFYRSIGTVGGGNHFIEYGEDVNDGTPWLTIHCGSRNFGLRIADYWKSIAQNPKRTKYNGYLSGDDFKGYLSDMVIAQSYALYNHQTIKNRIFDILYKLCKAKCVESIYTMHNYISMDTEQMILHKGSISADLDEIVCIPFNMRDGIAICKGKGNPEWLCTAPHGAGRAMSRNQAKKNIDINDYKNTMSAVFSTSISEYTLDESPMAYKDTQEILDAIQPTVDIISMIKPKINLKELPPHII